MSNACLTQGHSGVEGPCVYCGWTPPVRVGPWCDPMETLADLVGDEAGSLCDRNGHRGCNGLGPECGN